MAWTNRTIARRLQCGVLSEEELAVQWSRQVAARVVGPAGVLGFGMRPERKSQPQC
jgi:hypothetical protein